MKNIIFICVLLLLTFCKSPPHQGGGGIFPDRSAAAENVPRIAEPELAITSIAILQADIVVTRMKLSLKIDNPNNFPVTLSSFKYELFGDGAFWASGLEKSLAVVPAQSSMETSFEFDMNFINMKRRLLDDIIAMRTVHYRIVGHVEVEAAEIPPLRVNFDFSGNSEVKK